MAGSFLPGGSNIMSPAQTALPRRLAFHFSDVLKLSPIAPASAEQTASFGIIQLHRNGHDTAMTIQVRLLLASALMLFTELLLIRWLGGNVLHLSYFSNIVLLGSFLVLLCYLGC